MHYPLISVIIPTFNNETTVVEALQSITDQTYPNLEIVVINDNSTDETEIHARKFAESHTNVFVYNVPNNSTDRFNTIGRNINAGYSARNFGFTKIHGEWITFQDADDVSLRNRIEIQYDLAITHHAHHITIDWIQYDPRYVGAILHRANFINDRSLGTIGPKELYTLSQRSKGIMYKLFGRLNSYIPFTWKQVRGGNRIFFGTLDPYPCSGNSPLFRAEIVDKVQFRPLCNRVWPSFIGRGADRDFNMQVAETFKNSYCFRIPLYLWRAPTQNTLYGNLEKYMISKP